MKLVVAALRYLRQSFGATPCVGCGQRTPRAACDTCLAASSARHAFVAYAAVEHAEIGRVLRVGRYFRGPEVSPLAAALVRFKYRGDRATGHSLKRLLRHCAVTIHSEYDVVVPIPLHRVRLRTRGFNQAAWLARGIAAPLRVTVRAGALSRVRDGPAQAGASGSSRRRLQNAFVARASIVARRRVLLVDDVYTTGATAGDAARALIAAGATSVDVAVLLMAGGNSDDRA